MFCGCWSLSRSAAVQARAQRAGWARLPIMLHSALAIIHQRPPLSAAVPPCFHPPELSVSTLLDYIRWHKLKPTVWRFKRVFPGFWCDLGSRLMFSFNCQETTSENQPESFTLNPGQKARKNNSPPDKNYGSNFLHNFLHLPSVVVVTRLHKCYISEVIQSFWGISKIALFVAKETLHLIVEIF